MTIYNTLNKTDFQQHVLSNNKIVLVDFWAQWCGPCVMMTPALENLATDMANTIDIVKVDVDASSENAQLAQQYGVQGIPNMQIFKNGILSETLIGMRTMQDLKNAIANTLLKS